MSRTLRGRSLGPGAASGLALVLTEPLSLWGGLDPATGNIVDARHPQQGNVISRRVLVMPSGRGSSSSASVLAEATRLGTGPAAILIAEPDLILAIGAVVADELYGRRVPIVELEMADVAQIPDGARVVVESGGTVHVD